MLLLENYFQNLNAEQLQKFELFNEIFTSWNSKINLISRKDIIHFQTHHLLHSLAIARIFEFLPETKIIDVGTGGGLPGIPLAIFFPHCKITLVDSISKKINAVSEMCKELELENVKCICSRSEVIHEKFDFVTARAVSTIPDFMKISWHLISNNSFNKKPNGIIYLKGGDFIEEIEMLPFPYTIYNLNEYFKEEFFQTKKIIYIKNQTKRNQ